MTVEPAFLALTTTPSIAPSASDVTCPVRAAAVWLCAGCGAAWNAMAAQPAIKIGNRRCAGIDPSVEFEFKFNETPLVMHDHRMPGGSNPASKRGCTCYLPLPHLRRRMSVVVGLQQRRVSAAA